MVLLYSTVHNIWFCYTVRYVTYGSAYTVRYVTYGSVYTVRYITYGYVYTVRYITYGFVYTVRYITYGSVYTVRYITYGSVYTVGVHNIYSTVHNIWFGFIKGLGDIVLYIGCWLFYKGVGWYCIVHWVLVVLFRVQFRQVYSVVYLWFCFIWVRQLSLCFFFI